MLREAKDDLLAFTGFPVSHLNKIWSTNSLERLNKESNAAPTSSGSSPTDQPCYGSPAQFLDEAHDEWQVTAEGRFLSGRTMALLTANPKKEVAKPDLMTAS